MGRDIKVLQHGDLELWPLLGPFLCDRKVHKELGSAIYSAPGTTWFLAVDKNGHVIGFCSLLETSTAYWYEYAYVTPDRRHKGTFRALAAARDKHVKGTGKPAKVAVPGRLWPQYEARGWVMKTQRGSWIYGVRNE